MTVEPYAWLASGAYFTGVLALGEIARRGLGAASDVTRKAVLGAVALWSVPALRLFATPQQAAACFFVLTFLLYLSFRYEILAAVEDEGPGLGSVLAPLSAALLLLWLGESRPHIAAAGMVALAFGDGAAALVGRRRGTRKYRFLGHARTMEGTLALFLSTGAGLAPLLAWMGGLDGHQSVAFALIAATVAASVESVSVYGSDNLTVPVSTAAALLALVRWSA